MQISRLQTNVVIAVAIFAWACFTGSIISVVPIDFQECTAFPNDNMVPDASLSRDDIWIRDPFIQYWNGTYYMTGTCCGNGIKIFSSTDLETWDDGTLAYAKNDSNPWIDQNFWAPELHVRADANGTPTFYLFFSGIKDGTKRRTGCAISCNPLGPFVDHGPLRPIGPNGTLAVDALTPPDLHCLDGTLFHDPVSGKEYFIYCMEWINNGTGQVWLQEISPAYDELVGTPRNLWSASDARWANAVTDGPFMWYYDEMYYCTWSSFPRGGKYTTGYAWSTSLTGPWIQATTPLVDTDGGHAALFFLNKSWDRVGDLATCNDMDDLRISFHQPNGGDIRCRIAIMYFQDGRWKTTPSFIELNWDMATNNAEVLAVTIGTSSIASILAGILL
nr:family 43 glycosylhydrolase [Candidatus Sigynarchaeota archaeon]